VGEGKGNIDDFVSPGKGLLDSVEDIACGLWMGANWPTTRFFESNMAIPSPLYYAGGVRACERVAKKHSKDTSPIKNVRHASAAITVSYYAGCALWPVNLPIRLVRGWGGYLLFGEPDQ